MCIYVYTVPTWHLKTVYIQLPSAINSLQYKMNLKKRDADTGRTWIY